MRTRCIIIGAGHSGLAMSRYLSMRSIDHVVLERGEIANSWKHERWDSLKLLTPNWQTRLPGLAYDGPDPDGYMAMSELIAFLQRYAGQVSAPVEQNTRVGSVRYDGDTYRVATNRGIWQCDALVVASGACNRARVPAVAATLPASMVMTTPLLYRNPDQLPQAGVLVVGASATGLQLAEEIHRSGRPVTLAVGEHVRLARVYRGRDIQWWLDALGILDQGHEEIDDLVRGRGLPSPQLIGSREHEILDLNRLSALGVGLRGRLAGINDGKLQFSGSLGNVCALADLKMERLLNSIDQWATRTGLDSEIDAPHRHPATRIDDSPALMMDPARQNIKTILWATGYRPDYSWLQVPVLDRKGMIRHQGGIADSPGMYLMGMPLLRRRKSSFIHGAADDALELSAHLAGLLESKSRTARARPIAGNLPQRAANSKPGLFIPRPSSPMGADLSA
jgi:putative flavoprotein involved in K+ transport